MPPDEPQIPVPTTSEPANDNAAPPKEPEKPAIIAKGKAKGKAEPPAPDKPPVEAPPPPTREQLLEQLKGLAKQLEYEMDDDGRITTKQWAEFREARKKSKEAHEAQVRSDREALDKERGEWKSQRERVEAVMQAWEVGDFEGFAKALGEESWDAVQDSFIAKSTNPNYKELREMRAWREKQEAKEREREEQERATAEMAERERYKSERERYKSELSQMMKGSKDPLVAAMYDDPSFVEAVVRVQAENWDGEQTVTPERAVRIAAKGLRKDLFTELKELHERLGRAFGPAMREALEKAENTPANDNSEPTADKPTSDKTAIVDPKKAVEASASGKVKKGPDWDKYAREKMAEALEAEVAEELAASKKKKTASKS